MKQSTSQLAFDFFAASGPPPGEGKEPTAQEEQRTGVRVRIKSLKNPPPQPQPEEPVTPIEKEEIPPAAPVPENQPAPEIHPVAVRQIDLEEAIVREKEPEPQPEIEAEAEVEVPAPAPEALVVNMPASRPAPKAAPLPETTITPLKSKRGRKSLKQIAAEADLIDIPEDEVLFSKQYYTMGEVAEMFRVNQSLLRFWETEFSILQPRKNRKGDRYFRPVDIKNLHLIYHLLRQRKYTIEGAKEFLKKNKKAEHRFEAIQRLQQIKAFLLELKAQL